jgi:hypothetical protein
MQLHVSVVMIFGMKEASLALLANGSHPPKPAIHIYLRVEDCSLRRR